MYNPKTTKQHYFKYEELLNKKPSLFEMGADSYMSRSVGEWEKLYRRDVNLNNVPLAYFDVRFIAGLGLSMAESVCLHKHIIIYKLLGKTPEFTD